MQASFQSRDIFITFIYMNEKLYVLMQQAKTTLPAVDLSFWLLLFMEKKSPSVQSAVRSYREEEDARHVSASSLQRRKEMQI